MAPPCKPSLCHSCVTIFQEVFCKSCYAKAFGPKGYGFGGGAGTLQMTGALPQSWIYSQRHAIYART